ncbi:hypothetical protein ACIRU3_13025 [Streptomyces sp. NPDC101151]|uniref:hypothetical protein n=1 Tax=Streptomyces sp. NPDC101151 TaxID=3366115 RepID=UPI00382770C1
MAYAITAPTQGHTGTVAGIQFTDGRAEADELPVGALLYFQRRGYTVEDLDTGPPQKNIASTGNGPQDSKPAGRSSSRTTKKEE